MTVALVVAPHPDDETLGCGGTLLKLAASGTEIHWMIVSAMTLKLFSNERMVERQNEIGEVAKAYGFAGTHKLGFPTTRLDEIPIADMVGAAMPIVQQIKPNVVFLPYGGDAHSDHAATFRALSSTVKKFRMPCVNRVLVYETISETDNGIDPDSNGFRPNSFSDIAGMVDDKVRIMGFYKGEMRPTPFPRSAEAIRALALLRGGSADCHAAEAFMLLRETW